VPQAQPDEPQTPHPPRFRYLKRLSLLGALILLILGGIYYAWMTYAQSQLDAFVNAAHARGQKILLSDYIANPPAPEDNVAVLLRQAAAGIKLTKAQDEWQGSFSRDLPLSDDDVYNLSAIQGACADSLKLAHAARQRHSVDWGIAMRSPACNILLFHLNGARYLASISAAVALLDHARGDDAQACQLASDILFEAAALDTPPAFLVTHLVSIGTHDLAADIVIKIAPDLRISPSPTSQPSGAASPQQVRALINEFLDERQITQGLSDCWHWEQMIVIDTLPNIDRMTPSFPSPIAKLLRPMLMLSCVRAVNELEQLQVPTHQPTYPSAMATTRPIRFRITTSMLLTATRGPETVFTTGDSRILWSHFRVIANRRAAAILLALRLYALDHHGNLPTTLADLVPAYLPKLPPDPFSPDQRNFVYRPAGADPMIYSLAQNGVDDGGKTTTTMPAQVSPDYVYRLRPSTRRSPAPQ
jgi:hypothetical protein